jgi:hypothetical protein
VKYFVTFQKLPNTARHAKLVSLVERILELHKRPAARSPQEKESLQREIENTDKSIDRLVYELYGLSEEEIGLWTCMMLPK